MCEKPDSPSALPWRQWEIFWMGLQIESAQGLLLGTPTARTRFLHTPIWSLHPQVLSCRSCCKETIFTISDFKLIHFFSLKFLAKSHHLLITTCSVLNHALFLSKSENLWALGKFGIELWTWIHFHVKPNSTSPYVNIHASSNSVCEICQLWTTRDTYNYAMTWWWYSGRILWLILISFG